MISFLQLKKNAKKDLSSFKAIRVALLCDSASQFIHQAIKGYGFDAKVDYQIFEADYNQIDAQVFDPGSELYNSRPDYVVILRSTEHLNKAYHTLSADQRLMFATEQTDYIRSLCDAVNKRLRCKIILNDYLALNDGLFGNFSAKVRSSFLFQVTELNLQLMALSQEMGNVSVLNLQSMVLEAGYRNTFDPKVYYQADMVFSLDFLPEVARQLHLMMQTMNGNFKKCLVLDLDNTLWGGVIGDDGVHGIQIGSLGSGKIFSELQSWFKQLQSRGVILAVCSKNTESVAREPFLSHPDMVLQLEHIAVFVANWNNKVDNIRHIQQVLNIGMDSMVFVDDNPFERGMVQQAIPGLTVPDLPEDPAEYLLYLKRLNLFETASFTGEDQQRTEQYRKEAERCSVQQSFANEDEFLASLGMTSEVKPFDEFTIPRVAQLSQRSNQFNLRTVRYTEEDLKRMTEDADYHSFSFTLTDKFGDNGLIAFVVLWKADASALFIENWAMSCRVLKRGMEQFVLDTIVAYAEKKGYKVLIGEYLPTPKNAMVENHYGSLGFAAMEDGRYRLDLPAPAGKKTFITRIKHSYDKERSLKDN